MSDKQELRPVCFMVMPFQKKKVTGQTGKGAPKNIDCDALWDKAYRPAIEESGYMLSTAEQNQSRGRRKISPLDVMPYTVLRVVPVVHRRDPRCFV